MLKATEHHFRYQQEKVVTQILQPAEASWKGITEIIIDSEWLAKYPSHGFALGVVGGNYAKTCKSQISSKNKEPDKGKKW